jgi:hypothetical protein
VLSAHDDYTDNLSWFDRAARMKTDRIVEEPEYLQFVAKETLPWSETEKTRLQAAIADISPALNGLSLPAPKPISLIKTTGNEEGNAAYTRADSIAIPAKMMTEMNAQALRKLVAHELFHILTRRNPDLREALYASIGFAKGPEVVFAPDYAARRVSNPDATHNDHYIHVRFHDRPVCAIPLLIARQSEYDTGRGGEFFDYVALDFLIADRGAPLGSGSGSRDDDDGFRLVRLDQLQGFFEQVGENTRYVIHPEEILADNFALLVAGGDDVRSPVILSRMKRVFQQYAAGPLPAVQPVTQCR